MDPPRVIEVRRDRANPWYERVEKTIAFPFRAAHEVFHLIQPPDYVNILPCTPDGKVVLIREWRPALEAWSLELPAGLVEAGETPTQAAVRELAEETGCTASGMVMLGDLSPDTGRLLNRFYPFLAEGVIPPSTLPSTVQSDGIEVIVVTGAELWDLIVSGALSASMAITTIALAQWRGLVALSPLLRIPT